MESFIYRPAKQKDLEFIRELSAQVFSRYGNYEEIVLAWLEQGAVITEIIMEQNYNLGFAMLVLDRQKVLGSRTAHLLAIGILPEHQRRGVGRALLEHMEEVARKYNAVEMNLWTAVDNEPALSFFQKAGFEIERFESYYYPKGQAALAMSKKLNCK
ncbi:MAG: GNAT family N-acetyltransferase [Deltaproteobacteria bacterium]|nr:MAG: GNAT family N-acetyltransferase [Deltaproteobacteria bacterium]